MKLAVLEIQPRTREQWNDRLHVILNHTLGLGKTLTAMFLDDPFDPNVPKIRQDAVACVQVGIAISAQDRELEEIWMDIFVDLRERIEDIEAA